MVNHSSHSHMSEKAAYIKLFEVLAGHNLLLEANPPLFTILAATTQRLKDVGMTKEAVIGKALFEAHPGNTTDLTDNGVSNLRSSLDHVLRYKEVHQLPVQRYDLPDEQGGFSEKYWRASNRPVLNEEGKVAYIIHTAEDITHEIKAQEQAEKIKGLEQAYGLFMQAPFAIHIFTGPDLTIDLANPPTLELWGKTEDVTGKRFLDVLPELRGQGYDVMMHEVMQTGKSRFFYEVPLQLNRQGKEPIGYFSFVYQPYYKQGALKAESVLIIAHEVTQQVLAKKSREESEARFRNLIEEAPVATCLFVGMDLVMEIVNQRMLDIFGKGPHLQGMKYTDAVPELASQPFPELLRQVLLTGEAYTGYAAKAELFKDGKWGTYYFDSAYKPIRNEAGEVYAVLGMAIDVTEKTLAKKALEESEERYRTLLEETTVATAFYTGPEVRIQYANATMLRYWGKGGEAIGKTFRQAVPELESQPFPALLEKVYATGEPYIGIEEKAELVVDGALQPFYFNFTYKALRDAEGQVYAIHHTAVDVTEQVMARRKVEESRQNLHKMILQAPIAIAILRTKEYVVEIVNKHALEFWGRSYDEVINRPLFDALPELRTQGFREFFDGIYDSGVPVHLKEHPITFKRGDKWEDFYFNFLYEVLYDANGEINGLMAIGVDVTLQTTTRLKIEEAVEERTKELAQANRELKRSNANLEEFAHAASHDLKEPIRKITFFTHQLRDQLGGHLKEAEVRSFDRIVNATERMGNLIDDLLLYSHVSQRPHQMDSVDLNVKVQKVLEDLELDIQEKKAVITVGKLPVVKGYRRQLQQLFQNLISNALKYSKANIAPRIEITAEPYEQEGKRYHLIRVRDNGIGFDQEYAEKIFQMFTRLHGKNDYSGTGVGLSIVKKVVENHNGYIQVESTAGQGSTFSVLLPVE